MDFLWTEGGDHSHGTESRDENEQSVGTHGGQSQDTSSSQEKE
ncbi:rCG43145, partial [Rattus norvegicus]